MSLVGNAATWIADESEPSGDLFTIIKRWVSHAFTATVKWMGDVAYPTVAAGIVDALQLLNTHPHTALGISATVFFIPEIVLLPLSILRSIFLLLLRIIGFGPHGVVRGSAAARYQSQHYGGYTPASPALFAEWESIGMVHDPVVKPSNPMRAIIRWGAGMVFVYVSLGTNLLW
ncbi:hypothetical protein C8R47DRAFT_1103304 [Mycena vitilis]|nr:hypothetical protein C8R47DRAFT_1103304 [Mycena vitilis]